MRLHHLQQDADIALTVGACMTILSAVSFFLWCTVRARRMATIAPRSRRNSQVDTKNFKTMQLAPSVQVKYTHDTIQVSGSYIVYTVELTWGMSTKTLEKRYSEFDHFAHQLKKEVKATKQSIQLPHLPRKSLLFNFDDNFLEHRRLGLQEFLLFAISHPVTSELHCVRQFCGHE